MTTNNAFIDAVLLDEEFKQQYLAQYYDETNQKGYTIAEIILMKKDKTNQEVKLLSKQLTRLRSSAVGFKEPPPQFIIPQQRYPLKELSAQITSTTTVRKFDKIKVPKVQKIIQSIPIIENGVKIDKKFTVEIPQYHKTGWSNQDLPTYIPTYSSSNYDNNILSIALDNQLSQRYGPLGQSTSVQLSKLAYEEIYKVASENYYGAYSPEGQMIRLKSVLEIHRWSIQKPAFFTQDQIAKTRVKMINAEITQIRKIMTELDKPTVNKEESKKNFDSKQKYAKSLHALQTRLKLHPSFTELIRTYEGHINKIFPLGSPPVKIIVTSNSLTAIQTEWETAWGTKPPHKLYNFNMDSHSGILWPGKTHKETASSEIVFAASLLQDLAEGLETKQFWEKYDFIRLAEMKPKPEVYVRPHIIIDGENTGETKVRNIFGTLTAGALPAMAINALTYKLSPNALECSTSRHLLGFSHFHGGMDSLFKYMLGKVTDYKNLSATDATINVLVYADNLFLHWMTLENEEYKLHWVSMDGAKMEASQNFEELKLEMFRIFRYLGGTFKDSEKYTGAKMSNAFYRYIIEVYPMLVTRGVAVFGNEQTSLEFMMSGVVGTGYFNTVKMGLLAADLDGQKVKLSELFDGNKAGKVLLNLQDKHRIKLTVEKQTTINLGKNPRVAAQYEHILTTYKNTIIPLDFLGYDAYVIDVKNVKTIIPALMKDRLLKSMTFHKFGFYRKIAQNEEKEQEFAILSLVVFRALYVVGGYAYPELALQLRALIRKNLAILGITEHEVAALMDMTQKSPSLDFQQVMLSTLNMDEEQDMPASFFDEFLSFSLPSIETILTISAAGKGFSGPFGIVSDRSLKNFLNKFGGATSLNGNTDLVFRVNSQGFNPEDRQTVFNSYKLEFSKFRDSGDNEYHGETLFQESNPELDMPSIPEEASIVVEQTDPLSQFVLPETKQKQVTLPPVLTLHPLTKTAQNVKQPAPDELAPYVFIFKNICKDIMEPNEHKRPILITEAQTSHINILNSTPKAGELYAVITTCTYRAVSQVLFKQTEKNFNQTDCKYIFKQAIKELNMTNVIIHLTNDNAQVYTFKYNPTSKTASKYDMFVSPDRKILDNQTLSVNTIINDFKNRSKNTRNTILQYAIIKKCYNPILVEMSQGELEQLPYDKWPSPMRYSNLSPDNKKLVKNIITHADGGDEPKSRTPQIYLPINPVIDVKIQLHKVSTFKENAQEKQAAPKYQEGPQKLQKGQLAPKAKLN